VTNSISTTVKIITNESQFNEVELRPLHLLNCFNSFDYGKIEVTLFLLKSILNYYLVTSLLIIG